MNPRIAALCLTTALSLATQAAPSVAPGVKAPNPASAPAVSAPGALTPPSGTGAGQDGAVAASAPPATPPEGDPGRPDSVEIQVRRMADQLAAGMSGRKGQGRYDRWAVTPLAELGDEVQKRHLGEVVAEQVEGSLKGDHGFICVERLRLAKVINELALVDAGLVDESKAAKAGELAGADILVVGSVGLLGSQYIVNLRAVSVAEAKILAVASARFDAAGLVALSSDAVVLRTKSDAVFRSVIIPGWGQFYNRQTQKGAMIMFLGGALLAGGATLGTLGLVEQAGYSGISPENPGACAGAPSLSACVGDLRITANGRFSTANMLFIGYGLVYLYNILDAYLFGYEPDAATKKLYGDASIDWQPSGLSVRF